MQEGVKHNFILQQGFEEPDPAVCSRQFSALQFQGRTILAWIVAGILLQSSILFYVLCAVLWWGALLSDFNPLDAVYNSTLGRRGGAYREGVISLSEATLGIKKLRRPCPFIPEPLR